jgi:uncharacterized membrane protein YdjX (TVP38/TMEM64 family)
MTDADKAGAATPLWRRLLPLGVIALGLILFFALGLDRYLSIEALNRNQEALREWALDRPVLSVGLFMLAYAAAVAISVPGAGLLSIFGGFMFGVLTGTIAVVVAATVGATAIFLAAKGAFADALRSKASGFVDKMRRGFEEDELNYMFVLRLVPAFPFFAINIAAGLLGVSLRNYVIATALGIIPGSLVYVSIGNGFRKGIEAGAEQSLEGALLQPAVLLPVLGLVVLALIPVVVKRVRGKKPGEEKEAAA